MARLERTIDAATTGIIDLEGINEKEPHTQVCMCFIDNEGVEINADTGTFTISVKLSGAAVFKSLLGGADIDATQPIESLTYAGVGVELKYEPSSVTGADFINFVVRSTEA